MATSFADIEAGARQDDLRHELRRRWLRRIGLVIGLAMAVVFVLWANWMVQRYIVLGDDTARGERFRESLHPTGNLGERRSFIYAQCTTAAEVFYGHGILDGERGYAPPNEKAFFVACSGMTLGGRGGGQGD